MIHSTAIVAEQYILQQKYLKKRIGSAILGTQRRYNFQPPTQTLRATIHNVTNRQTEDSIMTTIKLCAAV